MPCKVCDATLPALRNPETALYAVEMSCITALAVGGVSYADLVAKLDFLADHFAKLAEAEADQAAAERG